MDEIKTIINQTILDCNELDLPSYTIAARIMDVLNEHGYITIKRSVINGLMKNVSELLHGLNNSIGGINV
jgi:ribosomal protein S8